MSRHFMIPVLAHGEHVHVHLHTLPPDVREAVEAAIVASAGAPLLKARRTGGEGPDPRYPEVTALVERMRSTWDRWTAWLVDRLLRALQGQRVADPRIARQLEAIFRQHEAGTLAATTGVTTDEEAVETLVREGALEPTYPIAAPVVTALQLGTTRSPTTPDRVPATPPPIPPPREPTDLELGAVAYVRERAAIYMRRPIASVQAGMREVLHDRGVAGDGRELSDRERGIVGDVIQRSVLDRASVDEVARRLRNATTGTALTNDMQRVARTELQFAHNYGHYLALKAQVTTDNPDPFVYKIVSPAACEDCRRIWGHPSNPKKYRLSVVEAFDLAGGNFRRPHGEWGPTIGPTHPNCTCPGLLLWDPEVHDAVEDIAEELARVYGRGPT